MEINVMLGIAEAVKKGEDAALVTLVQIDGSSPGKKGNIMGVFENGKILGTVGGGNLEHTLIKEALNAIRTGESKEIEFDLVEEAALHMKCGGSVKAFIKVFKKKEKIVIIGGGHVGGEIYEIGNFMNFEIAIFDDREEFCNSEKYPKAQELFSGDIEKNLLDYPMDSETYVVIVTRGHKFDKIALREILKKNPKYIGMIGSRKKIIETYQELMEEGVSREKLETVYAPVGLDISSGSPKEIALSIVAEILAIKNNCSGKHMREVKTIKF